MSIVEDTRVHQNVTRISYKIKQYYWSFFQVKAEIDRGISETQMKTIDFTIYNSNAEDIGWRKFRRISLFSCYISYVIMVEVIGKRLKEYADNIIKYHQKKC